MISKQSNNKDDNIPKSEDLNQKLGQTNINTCVSELLPKSNINL